MELLLYKEAVNKVKEAAVQSHLEAQQQGKKEVWE